MACTGVEICALPPLSCVLSARRFARASLPSEHRSVSVWVKKALRCLGSAPPLTTARLARKLCWSVIRLASLVNCSSIAIFVSREQFRFAIQSESGLWSSFSALVARQGFCGSIPSARRLMPLKASVISSKTCRSVLSDRFFPSRYSGISRSRASKLESDVMTDRPSSNSFARFQPDRVVVAEEFAAGLDKAGGSGTAPDPAAEAVPRLENGHIAIVDQLTRSHQACKAATDNRHPRPRCYAQRKPHGFDCCRGLALLRCSFFRNERLAFGAGDLLAVSAMQAAIKRAHLQEHPKSKGTANAVEDSSAPRETVRGPSGSPAENLAGSPRPTIAYNSGASSREGASHGTRRPVRSSFPNGARQTRARAAPARPMLNPSVDQTPFNDRRSPAHDVRKIDPIGQISKSCPALSVKIFRFRRRANQFYQLAPSHPGKRGGSRSSRTRDGMRWTRQRRRGR